MISCYAHIMSHHITSSSCYIVLYHAWLGLEVSTSASAHARVRVRVTIRLLVLYCCYATVLLCCCYHCYYCYITVLLLLRYCYYAIVVVVLLLQCYCCYATMLVVLRYCCYARRDEGLLWCCGILPENLMQCYGMGMTAECGYLTNLEKESSHSTLIHNLPCNAQSPRGLQF